jgi:hypothetical protein
MASNLGGSGCCIVVSVRALYYRSNGYELCKLFNVLVIAVNIVEGVWPGMAVRAKDRSAFQ